MSRATRQRILGDVFFAPRFFARYAGKIIKDPITAIIELVANAWDARATEVHITWPTTENLEPFRIVDNGIGMTKDDVLRRWRMLDYNRLEEQGNTVKFPPGANIPSRTVFGQNGRGRFAAFYFSKSYLLATGPEPGGRWRKFRVVPGTDKPIELEDLGDFERDGHGTEIVAEVHTAEAYSPDQIRSEIGMRFLSDPNFQVFVNGQAVKFDDINDGHLEERFINVPGYGDVRLVIIDAGQSDLSTKQHGIAWRVRNRLVGEVTWKGTEQERFDLPPFSVPGVMRVRFGEWITLALGHFGCLAGAQA